VGAVLAGTYFHRDFGPDVAGVGVYAMTGFGNFGTLDLGSWELSAKLDPMPVNLYVHAK
jgi:hypothetical protein